MQENSEVGGLFKKRNSSDSLVDGWVGGGILWLLRSQQSILAWDSEVLRYCMFLLSGRGDFKLCKSTTGDCWKEFKHCQFHYFSGFLPCFLDSQRTHSLWQPQQLSSPVGLISPSDIRQSSPLRGGHLNMQKLYWAKCVQESARRPEVQRVSLTVKEIERQVVWVRDIRS